ncbi:MAG TPA: DUF5985 family protein [Verrucomicrobiae bacterium]|jgi:hypothetical protein|nr:DUF5985 family protein [Verrucomicrobiae bacterium]
MISSFVAGCTFFGFLIVAGHFFKFWRTTQDRFFLFFAIAFLLFAIEKVCVALIIGAETISWIYLVRLLASCFILAAIIEKNRK